MAESRCLVVFTKPAIPGRVKTRLIGSLKPEEAAELHEAFLGDLVERMGPGAFHLELAWALSPGESVPSGRYHGFAQRGVDLGERLWNGLDEALSRFRFAAAVGSDHPDLPVARVEEAFERLEGGADVVLGPAEDGGYYLVGVGRDNLDRGIFEEIPWSTGGVLGATLERCRELSLRAESLAPAADVDTPDDLGRLARRLTQSAGEAKTADCPRTLRLLRSWKLVGEETR